MVLECRRRGGDAGAVRLVQGRLFLGVGLVPLLVRFQPFPAHPTQATEQGGGEEDQQERDQRPAPARAGQPGGRPHRPRRHLPPLPEAPEVLGQRQGAGVATGRLLLQGVQDDGLQVARQARLQAARPGRLVGQDRAQHLQGAVAAERQLPRQQLVKYHPQCVRVRRRPHEGALAAGLLGSHVPGGADQEPALRQGHAALGRLGESEVGDLGHRLAEPRPLGERLRGSARRSLGVEREQHIRRLQVAVDDALAVRHVDGAGQRLDERGRLARGPGPAVQAVRQAAALGPLQGQEGPALVAADLVDLHDVGVPHPRRQLRLQPEARLLGGRRELARQHHLQRRRPVEAPVPRLVHHPHAAAADLAQDVVVPDLPGGRGDDRLGPGVACSRGRPGLLPLAQRADRRTALGRADQQVRPPVIALLQSRQQGVGGGQLIDAAATRRAVAQVGGDAGQLRVRELAQGQRAQLFVGRMVQRRLARGKPVRGRAAAKSAAPPPE